MKRWVFSTLVGAGSVVAGAGVATGIILPSTLKLKKGLSKLVPGSGGDNYGSWSTKKLNYVALGDSETAGYNGFMHEYDPKLNVINEEGDYLSYADFLAKDLQNAGKLNTYHNYAVSGATISDQMQLFLENSQMHEPIKNADFITITLGANDLLSFVKLLKLQFSGDILSVLKEAAAGNIQKIVATNHAKDLLFPAGDNKDIPVNAGKSSTQTVNLFTQSFGMLVDMAKAKDYTKIIDIEHDFKEEIFELLYGSYMALIKQLHSHAPHAQILIVGHAMPFEQWPDEVINSKRDDLNGQSIRSMFNRLLDSMKDAANFSLTGKSKYDSYIGVDELHIKKSSDPSRDGANKKFIDYIKKDDKKSDFYVQNAMPNAGDIHPSTFGHELIGNSIFSSIFSHLGLSQEDTSFYTYSTRYTTDAEKNYDVNTKNFMAYDENPALTHSSATLIYDLLRGDGIVNKILKKFGTQLKNIIDTNGGSTIIKVLIEAISGGSIDSTMQTKLITSFTSTTSALNSKLSGKELTDSMNMLKAIESLAYIYLDSSIFSKGFITSLYATITMSMSHAGFSSQADFIDYFKDNSLFKGITFMDIDPAKADSEKAKIKQMIEAGNAISLILDPSRVEQPTDTNTIQNIYNSFITFTNDITTFMGSATVSSPRTEYERTATQIYLWIHGLGGAQTLGNGNAYQNLLLSILMHAASLI